MQPLEHYEPIWIEFGGAATQLLVTIRSEAGNVGPRPISFPPFPEHATLEQARQWGKLVFDTIFVGEMRDNLIRTETWAKSKGHGVRIAIVLHEDAPHTAPWEFLTKPDGEQFLTLDPAYPLVRVPMVNLPQKPLEANLPLRLLVVTANPRDYPLLDIDEEWRSLQTILAPLEAEGLLIVKRLALPTVHALQEELRSGYELFHFSGHGQFNSRTTTGEIIFETSEGNADPISAERLATLLRDNVRLAVLNTCDSATTTTGNFFAGIAPRLLKEAEVGAVVAMQHPIRDGDAKHLIAAFYGAIADGHPVDAALAEGRKALNDGVSLAWATPVLYMNTENGMLFRLPSTRRLLYSGPSPYPGLVSFTESDHQFFFGRTILIDNIIHALNQQHFLAVIGASGSGKSSVVRAGVLPTLQGLRPSKTLIPADAIHWCYATFKPDSHPLMSLARELVRHQPFASLVEADREAVRLEEYVFDNPSGLATYVLTFLSQIQSSALCLVVDQFEEIFTHCESEEERKIFIQALAQAATVKSLRIIITLRNDFYHHCARYPDLHPILAQHQVVPALTVEDIRDIIELPATATGAIFAEGLVTQLVRDVGDEPGYLPLLAHALRETWERRSRNQMTWAGYRAIHGVQGAIATTANAVYQLLSPLQQELTRAIFLELAVAPQQGTPETRRRVRITHLEHRLSHHPEFVKILTFLTDKRLLVTSLDSERQPSVEVAHEALIREWDLLRAWLNESQQRKIFLEQIQDQTLEWRRLNKDAALLMGGVKLEQARQWYPQVFSALTPEEHAFYEASVQKSQRELANLRRTILLLSIAVCITLVFGVMALLAQRVAERETTNAQNAGATAVAARDQAESEAENARESQATAIAERERAEATAQRNLGLGIAATARELLRTTNDKELATLLSIQAINLVHTNETVTTLNSALQSTGQTLHLLRHNDSVLSSTFSPDFQRIVTTSWDHSAKVWDAATGELLYTVYHDNDWVVNAAWSPDGQWLATVGRDYTARIWDAQTGEAYAVYFHIVPHPYIHQVAWSPDSRYLLTTSDGTVFVWEVDTRPITMEPQWQQKHTITAIVNEAAPAWSPDGLFLFSFVSETTVAIWETDTGKLSGLLAHPDEVHSAMWSKDGSQLLTAADDGVVRIWNMQPTMGQPTVEMTFTQSTPAETAVWSPDQSMIAVSTREGVYIWNTTRQALVTILADAAGADLVQWSFDNQYLAVASQFENLLPNAHIWDVTNEQLVATLHHQNAIQDLEWATGHRLATASYDQTARIWTLFPDSDTSVKDARGGNDTTISPDGQWLAVAHGTGVDLWDLPTETFIAFLPHPYSLLEVEWAPEGNHFLSRDRLDVVRVWRATDLTLVAQFPHQQSLYPPAWSPDGTKIAASINPTTVQIWDIGTGQSLHKLHNVGHFHHLSWSPNGQYLAVGQLDIESDIQVRIWDPNTGALLWSIEPTEIIDDLAWSPDAAYFSVVTEQGNVIVWDSKNHEVLRVFSEGSNQQERGNYASSYGYLLAWAPDGKHLAMAGLDLVVRVWNFKTGVASESLLHEDNITNLEWAPDSLHLATGGMDAKVNVWNSQSGETIFSTRYDSIVSDIEWNPYQLRLIVVNDQLAIHLLDSVELVTLACEQSPRSLSETEWRTYFDTEYKDFCNDFSHTIGVARYWAQQGDIVRVQTLIESVLQQPDSEYALNQRYPLLIKNPSTITNQWVVATLWSEGRDLAEQAIHDPTNRVLLLEQASDKFTQALDLNPHFLEIEPHQFARQIMEGKR